MKSTKNILLITNSNFPFGGASANVLRLLTTGLVKAGNSVNVLLQRGMMYGAVTESEHVNNYNGVDIHRSGYKKRPDVLIHKTIDSLAGILFPPVFIVRRYIRNQVDVVLLYSSSFYEVIMIVMVCKALKIPVVSHTVEWYEKKSVATSFKKIPLWWDFNLRMKFLNKYFDGLILTSSFLSSYYQSVGVESNRIFILPNLIDIEIFETDTTDTNNEVTPITKIGYCGTPTRKDGIDDLLESFAKISEIHSHFRLLIIGDSVSGTSLIPELKEKTKSLGISEKVDFTGLVPFSQMPGLLQSCDVLVLARPSGRFAEAGFPTKLGEYMACKKPVVATRVGDIPKYLTHEKDIILVVPDNIDSIGRGIEKACLNKEQAETIGTNGYNWAKSNLWYVSACKRVDSFLRHILV